MCHHGCGCGSCSGGCGCSSHCGCGSCGCHGAGIFGTLVAGFLAMVVVAALMDVADRQPDTRQSFEPTRIEQLS